MYGYLQFLYVWDPEVHEVLFLALLVMAIAVLSGGGVHLILAGQVLQVEVDINTQCGHHTPCLGLTGNSGFKGVTILAVMFSISVEARQPFSSSTVTTNTLVCSASKCSRAASSPSFADTTTDWGTPLTYIYNIIYKL